MAAASTGRTRFRDLLTNGKTQHFRRMMLGASSQLMQQVGGCNAVIYYFPILFEASIGESRHMSLVMGGVNMIVYSAFATVSWFIVERAGRRKMFLWGTVGQLTSMIITFACLIPGTPTAAKGAAAGLFMYIAAFGATWLPLPWLYPAEINPLRTRGKANGMSLQQVPTTKSLFVNNTSCVCVAVSTITNWLFNFLIVMITPIMIDRIGWGTYLFFGAMNASFLPIIYFFYPETRMRSLEEIDFIFAKGYLEKTSYVKAAKDLPMMAGDANAIERMMVQYGFVDQPSAVDTSSTGGISLDGTKAE